MNTYLKLESLNGKTKGIVMKADFRPNIGEVVDVTSNKEKTYPMKVVGIIEDEEEKKKYKTMPVWVELEYQTFK